MVWVPLTWDLKQTLTGFRDTPWRHQFCPVLLHPIKILGTQSLPPTAPRPRVPCRCALPSVRAYARPVCGLRPAGGSLKHLHEEGVDGGVTDELEEKQML